MPKTTIEYQAVREQVDTQTGEVVQMEISTDTRTIHKTEPPYIKLYIEDMLYTKDMPKSLSGLTYSLLKRARYAKEGLRVDVSTYVKHEILAECGYEKLQSLTNALGKLCKGNIIRRLGSGTYQLNPYLFGRGEWKDIDNIRATWDYNAIKGRTFAVALTYKDGTTQTAGADIQEPDVDYPDGSEDDRLNAEERADRYDPAV